MPPMKIFSSLMPSMGNRERDGQIEREGRERNRMDGKGRQREKQAADLP